MTGHVAIESAEYFVREGELYATVTLVRSGDISGTATVTISSESLSAIAGADYQPPASLVDFGRRVSRKTVSISLVDDVDVEPREHFGIRLSGTDPDSRLGARITAIVTIVDDDADRESPQADTLVPAYRATATAIGGNFRAPVTMAFLPNTNIAFVAEKSGYVKVLDVSVDQKPAVILDLRDAVNSYAERGLLGLAVHPDPARHPYLYAYFSVDPPGTGNRTGAAARDGPGNRFSHLVRYTLDLSGALPSVIEGSAEVLLGGRGQSAADISGGGALDFTDEALATNRATNVGPDGSYRQDLIKVDSQTHVGGALAFGPDGALYVGVGDGSSYRFADPRATNAQDIDSLNGKVLRVDPLTGLGLPDNPFAGSDLGDNRSKVWAIGLRNPYTMAFAADGRLFLSDTGWNAWEEVNVAARAGNYGWPYFEGGDLGELLPTDGFSDRPDTAEAYSDVRSGRLLMDPPYRAFSHREADPGFQVGAIVGASSVYKGNRYPPEFSGAYFFSDIVDGEIYAIDTAKPGEIRYVTDLGGYGPTSLRQGADGYLYLTDMVTDRLLRLEIEPFSPPK